MTRLLFVVQRYGARVAGGAETFCRAYAERLAARGFDIEVVSSCATNYVDWKNDLQEGSFVEDGVLIHRLPVTRPRSDIAFGPLNARVMRSSTSLPYHLQRSWMQMQGPYIGELPPWIAEHAHRFDAVVFFTYLYYPTWAGLPVASSRTTTVLHPTAHDEPPLAMPLFDLMFRQAHGFGFLTEEESQLVRRRFAVSQPFTVTGVGTELERSGDAPRFRRAFPELSDFPYLLYVGR
ncbi:MAG TPA: glycosyltransferase, partial [Acidimicrobiales bacterium]|nr:glycosyltransferase [Acidimicrobiales bacterium]